MGFVEYHMMLNMFCCDGFSCFINSTKES